MFKLAWRNLFRNRTRVFITVSAIALSYATFLISMGVQENTYEKMQKSAAVAAGGSVLIHGDGYWENQLNDILLEDADSILKEVRSRPDVTAAAKRMFVIGLATSSTGSTGVRLQGIEQEPEKAFQDLSPHVTEGKFLDCEESPIALGAKAAEELNAKIGDRIVFTASGPDGEVARALFFLCDTIKTGSDELDSALAVSTFDLVSKSFGRPGAATQVGMLTADRFSTQRELAAKYAKADDEPSIEVLTWDEAMPDLVGLMKMDQAFGNVYGFIVFIVVAFAITNTFLMVVMERIREFGLLSALGLAPRQVATILMYETFLVALVGIGIGFALGLSGHLAIAHYGVNMMELYGLDSLDIGGISMTDPVFYSTINPARWVKATVAVFVMTMASAIYPAWKAARMAPSESMRFFA